VKPGPLVAAAALAAFLVLRRRKLEPTLLVGGALCVVGLLVYGSGLVELPNIEALAEDAGRVLGKWTYLVVALAAFLETGAFVGLIAPGETFMVLGGVVAGQGRVSLIALIALTWAAAVAGDVTSFYLGRRLGRSFLVRHGPKFQITEERLEKVETFFDRHGGKAILIGRFVGLIRAIAPFLAGSSGMPMRRFLPYDIIGAGAWASAFLVLGYVFWQRFSAVLNYAKQGAFWLAATIVVIVGAIWLVRWLRVPENRARLRARINAELERPALRPLAAVLRPAWRVTRAPRRFVYRRLTPGNLGLELTTLGAVASVGSFVFLGYLVALHDTDLTGGDRRALSLADELRADWLVSVAKVVTHIGSLPVTGSLIALTAVVLAARRRVATAAALVISMVVVFALVHITKAAVDRSRPPHPLDESLGASYPSGHAAYGMAWVAAAVAITRTIPGIARSTALVVAAVVVAVVVGLTRMYLRVHYLSDVLGGAGLSAMVFGLCGMATLVVVHVRQNEARS
jgi:undecaprenyl-diphosphatase